jgi:hypothetical protein
MRNLITGLTAILFISFTVFSLSSCEDCEVKPDLISDLLVPSTDIIYNEPTDWDYVVASVQANSEDCDILNAVASIASIAIDFFTTPDDNDAEEFYNQEQPINPLQGGESSTQTNSLVFDQMGIFMLQTCSDVYNDVDERNENNNSDNVDLDFRSSDDIFQGASQAFREKLSKTAAIVVVGEGLVDESITLYNGIPIYHVKQ